MYFSARTEGIRTFRHALRDAYRTAISAVQILVYVILGYNDTKVVVTTTIRLRFDLTAIRLQFYHLMTIRRPMM